MERTYTGPLQKGRQRFPDGSHVDFVRGVPVEVTQDQAKSLDGDWHTPKSKAAKATPVPPQEGD